MPFHIYHQKTLNFFILHNIKNKLVGMLLTEEGDNTLKQMFVIKIFSCRVLTKV